MKSLDYSDLELRVVAMQAKQPEGLHGTTTGRFPSSMPAFQELPMKLTKQQALDLLLAGLPTSFWEVATTNFEAVCKSEEKRACGQLKDYRPVLEREAKEYPCWTSN